MDNSINYVLIFRALADETRLKIVEMLSCGEMCACDILEFFRITQPTLSYHMKILTDSQIVSARKDGSWIRYSLKDETAISVRHFLEMITTKREECICNMYRKESRCGTDAGTNIKEIIS
jgi:ArsR family transcriptional regulator